MTSNCTGNRFFFIAAIGNYLICVWCWDNCRNGSPTSTWPSSCWRYPTQRYSLYSRTVL